MSSIILGCIVGFVAWFVVRYLVAGLYSVTQNERAVKTSFGRAERIGTAMTADSPIAEGFSTEEKELYNYPQLRVIEPGGPYFKWPWEEVHKVVVSTQTLNMALDPENPVELDETSLLEAVTTRDSRGRSAGIFPNGISMPTCSGSSNPSPISWGTLYRS